MNTDKTIQPSGFSQSAESGQNIKPITDTSRTTDPSAKKIQESDKVKASLTVSTVANTSTTVAPLASKHEVSKVTIVQFSLSQEESKYKTVSISEKLAILFEIIKDGKKELAAHLFMNHTEGVAKKYIFAKMNFSQMEALFEGIQILKTAQATILAQ